MEKTPSVKKDIKRDSFGNKPTKLQNVVSALLTGDSSERTHKLFEDTLNGKSIILENVKSQQNAMKSTNKAKRSKNRMRLASNTWLKKNDLGNQIKHVDERTLLLVYDNWKKYMQRLMQGCQGEAQLQTRLHTAEVLGAAVIVVESTQPNIKVGLKGIVLGKSSHCMYIQELKPTTEIQQPQQQLEPPQPPQPQPQQQQQQPPPPPHSVSDSFKLSVNANDVTDATTTTTTTTTTTAAKTGACADDVHCVYKDSCVLGLLLPPKLTNASNSNINKIMDNDERIGKSDINGNNLLSSVSHDFEVAGNIFVLSGKKYTPFSHLAS